MSDSVKEQLSAFIDGELPEAEAELFLRRLTSDDTLRARAGHYELIGSTLRRERSVSLAFADRVRAGLDSEPEYAGGAGSAPVTDKPAGRFARFVAGGAIAASVAMLAVLGLRGIEPTVTASPAAIAETVVGDERETYTTPVAPPAAAPVNLRVDPQLVNYMLRHSRTTRGLSRNDMGERIISSDIAEGSDAADESGAADELESSAATAKGDDVR